MICRAGTLDAIRGVSTSLASYEQKSPDRVSLRRPLSHGGLETLAAHYVRQSFKPHAHDEYLIGVITGGAHAVWCRGEWHSVLPGTLMTMHPGDVHHGGAAIEDGWVQRMFYVSEQTMSEILGDRLGNDTADLPDFRVSNQRNSALAGRLEQIHQTIHSSSLSLSRETALVAFADIVAQLASGSSRIGTPAAYVDDRTKDIVDFLHDHVADDVSLGELAALVGLGRRQTINLFKAQTGLPPHAYHIGLKIRMVQDLLRAGDSIAAASGEAGFADQSHMTRHFTAIVGTTPLAYSRA